jgi:20S proteasome alpha/beta subunit
VTTIAYRDGVLAGDTRSTNQSDEILPGHVRKVYRLRNGSLIAFAGMLASIQAVVSKIKKDPNGILTISKSDGSNIEGLLIYPDGKVMQFDGSGWTSVKADYYAIGSGAVVARVAMRLGLSAKEAVRLAFEFVPSTGGRIQTVKLK